MAKNMEQTKDKLEQNGFIKIPDGRIYYESYGKGIPIILLHGNGENLSVLKEYGKELEKHCRVILMDSRAHGRSTIKMSALKKKTTAQDMAEDVKVLMDVIGIHQAVFLGFSDGANTALQFAASYPQRTKGVIAVSPNANPKGLVLPIRIWAKFNYNLLGGIHRFVKHHAKAEKEIQKQQLYMNLLLDSPNLTQNQLRCVKCPVLIFTGTWDIIKKEHIHWIAKNLKNSHVIRMQGATHLSFYRRKQEYLPCIWKFLNVAD